MNKIFLGILLVVAVIATWFILNPGDTFDYVVTADKEITQLENDLASLDAQVTAGTLTEDQATTAKVNIITRLNAINTATIESEKAALTPAQRAQLIEGLDRLKNILITYQATLATVDAAADNTAVEASLATKTRTRSIQNTGNRSLNLVIADVIADVEETVQDSVQDYEPNAELDASIDVIIDEAETVEAEEEMEAEMMEDESITTDETTVSEMDDLGSDPSDSMDTMDASVELDADVEVSADAGLDVTTTN